MIFIFIGKNDAFFTTQIMASKLQNCHVFKTSHLVHVTYYDVSKIKFQFHIQICLKFYNMLRDPELDI